MHSEIVFSEFSPPSRNTTIGVEMMKRVNIVIDQQEKHLEPGLTSVEDIYGLADCEGERLFLNREDGIDIPLLPGEYLLIHGGEKLLTGKSDLEDNPPLRNEIKPRFNNDTISLPRAKITGGQLKENDDKFSQGRLFADIEDGVDIEIPDDVTVVVQEKDSYFVIPPAEDTGDDSVDIEQCGIHERRPPRGHKYRIRIDGEKFTVESTVVAGVDILKLAGKNFDEWTLNQKLHGGRRIKIKTDDDVDLTKPGVERFETVRMQAQQGDTAAYRCGNDGSL